MKVCLARIKSSFTEKRTKLRNLLKLSISGNLGVDVTIIIVVFLFIFYFNQMIFFKRSFL